MDDSDSGKSRHRSLLDEFNDALPDEFRCRVRYVRSRPQSCDALFPPLPGRGSERTRLSNHFLLVSLDPASHSRNDNSREEPKSSSPSDVAFLAIEVLIYKTAALTTIFVSKADSTGYLPVQRPSPVKPIATTFLKWLVAQEKRRSPKRKLVISLFARAQSQYLFPGSAENSSKHVLDDRQLIKWWAKVLDPLFLDHRVPAEPGSSECTGHITVPGYNGQAELRPFLPPSSISASPQRWKAGHPLYELGRSRGILEDAPPRCLLPRFPDDPKARFIQDLDDEVGIASDSVLTSSPSKRRNGRWKTIRDLDRFWEAMEYRQECSSGRVVGFLWVVLAAREDGSSIRKLGEQETVEKHSINTPDSAFESQHQMQSKISSPQNKPSTLPTTSSPKRKRKILTGPIIPRPPRLKCSSSTLPSGSEPNGLVTNGGMSELVLSHDGYSKAMHTLLHLDFANRVVAALSTCKWAAEVASIAGASADWSSVVVGKAKTIETASANSITQVNDLGGLVKKKRKVTDLVPSNDAPVSHGDVQQQTTVNVLSSGLVRKKPKSAGV